MISCTHADLQEMRLYRCWEQSTDTDEVSHVTRFTVSRAGNHEGALPRPPPGPDAGAGGSAALVAGETATNPRPKPNPANPKVKAKAKARTADQSARAATQLHVKWDGFHGVAPRRL